MSKSREHPLVSSAGRQLEGPLRHRDHEKSVNKTLLSRFWIPHKVFKTLVFRTSLNLVQRLNPQIQLIVNRNTEFTVTPCFSSPKMVVFTLFSHSLDSKMRYRCDRRSLEQLILTCVGPSSGNREHQAQILSGSRQWLWVRVQMRVIGSQQRKDHPPLHLLWTLLWWHTLKQDIAPTAMSNERARKAPAW